MYLFVMKRDLQMTCTYFFNQKVIWWRPHVWPAMLWLWRIWEVRLTQRKGSLTVNIKRPKSLGLPRWHSGKESTCHAGDAKDVGLILQARILEWVAFPSSRRSSQPRDPAQVSRIAGGFFTSWVTREAQENAAFQMGLNFKITFFLFLFCN